MISRIATLNVNYPEGPLSDALEALVQQSLPRLPGLEEATSVAERLAVYSKAIKAQREKFIALHGDAFGVAPARLQRGALASRSIPIHRLLASAD